MYNDCLSQLTDRANAQGRPFRLLVVDDEEWMRDVFVDFCKLSSAITVDIATNGEEAINKTSSNRYDLITLDLIMPDISGLDALQQIKEHQPQVPVMVITGNATERVINKAGVLGACKVLYKPVHLDDFVHAMTSALIRQA